MTNEDTAMSSTEPVETPAAEPEQPVADAPEKVSEEKSPEKAKKPPRMSMEGMISKGAQA